MAVRLATCLHCRAARSDRVACAAATNKREHVAAGKTRIDASSTGSALKRSIFPGSRVRRCRWQHYSRAAALLHRELFLSARPKLIASDFSPAAGKGEPRDRMGRGWPRGQGPDGRTSIDERSRGRALRLFSVPYIAAHCF